MTVILKKGTYGTIEITSPVESETLHKVPSLEPARPTFLISEAGAMEWAWASSQQPCKNQTLQM